MEVKIPMINKDTSRFITFNNFFFINVMIHKVDTYKCKSFTSQTYYYLNNMWLIYPRSCYGRFITFNNLYFIKCK